MSNQTIDGVPRELLERLLGETTSWPSSAWVSLRDLLDAPASPLSEIEVLRAAVQEIEAMRDARVDAKLAKREPVAWRTYRGGVYELFGSLQEAEDDIAQWASIAAPHDDYDRTPTPLYAEQPAPVAVVLPERIQEAEIETLFQEGKRVGWNGYDDVMRGRLKS